MVSLAVFFDIGDTLVNERGWQDGACDCLNALSDGGLRLGIISNTGSLSRDELADRLPADFDFALFDDPLILLSSEVGLEKPDPEIFLKAVELSDLSPKSCVFIGENLSETWAAQSVDMNAFRVCHFPGDFRMITELLTDD